jgi:hypothetical protein
MNLHPVPVAIAARVMFGLPACLIAAAMLMGCALPQQFDYALDTRGNLALASVDGDGRIDGQADIALFREVSQSEWVALLIRGSAESPRQVFVLRMLWRPRIASTPLSPSATNATFTCITFLDDGQVAVYSGAGFLYTATPPRRPTLDAAVWDGSVSLSDATEGFEDTLGLASIKGRFSARADDGSMTAHLKRIEEMLALRLGYPRAVHQPATTSPTLAQRR